MPRTRLVWRTAEIKRTGAALAAMVAIGAFTAAVCWAGLVSLAVIATAVTGG